NAAAFVVLTFESKRIEDLDFVAVLQIDAAVGPLLPARVGFEWKQKFKMGLKVRKALFAFAAGLQQVALVDVRARPGIAVGTIEQNNCAFGLRAGRSGLGTEGRAFALGFFHGPRSAIGAVDGDLSFGQFGAILILAGEQDFAAVAFAVHFLLEFLVPTGAGQPAFV